MWVLTRYALSVGADFIPTSAYCSNAGVFRNVLSVEADFTPTSEYTFNVGVF